ncbi:MAG: LysR family transcriptional regulator [Desulfocapsa sp.]|nr:LysR family transcriptional regulator [Desulfocapsa sp.]
MDLTFRHLQQIQILAKRGNFAKAAQELHISQPALSRSLASLEKQLGMKLFDRSKREVVTTVFGEHLLQRGKPVLQEMQLLERDLHLLQSMEAGELVIGSGPFPAESLLGKAVARFSKTYPKVNVRIILDRTPNLLTRLHKRELDIFVADTRVISDTSDLDITPLPQQQGYFCCRHDHPLTQKEQLEMKDIFTYPLAVMWFPKVLLNALAKIAGLHINDITDLPCAVLQCDYLKVLFDIIGDSDATGLITRPLLNNNLQQQLALLPLTIPVLTTHYGLVTLSRYSQPPVVQIFHDYLVEAEEECRGEVD